ncbi:TlpA family protein disulfide reductase [Winogradskyella immobilis]|uniref:Redoxin domain-containing protein n=1 Tax=Winogradskyella immobilis TaxID=2816852 RepID=A0ABS8EMH7_9FLAO|nr:thioredoxin-like domain-containing protein [Winogradskyella immobilis]MCC1484419.1 redoxin domain-containing protein [Winogradskyella immobilis]MCG0016511.1 redoxin domain-containing protein [Winogradskyella immobilis]
MKQLIFVILISPFLGFTQQQIHGTFSPATDFTYAFLYRATTDGADYVERAKLDSLGNFTIKLDESAEPGIYKIVYAVPPEENNFDFIYNGKEDVAFNFSFDNGVEFTESIENKLWNSYLKSMEMVNQTISNYYTKENVDKKGFDAIFKTLKDTQLVYEDEAKEALVKTFITSNKPYIPEGFQDVSTYSENLKNTYFNNIDFSNTLLQSSTFIRDRVNAFIFGLSSSSDSNSYKELIEILVNKLNNYSDEIKSTQLRLLWEQFAQQDNHDIANYISDKYLFDIAKATNDTVLEQTLTSYKNVSVGSIAPDFEIISTPNTLRLSDLKDSDQYLLIFWSSTCGHCLSELPMVKKLLETQPNIKVIAFGLEDNRSTWDKEIKNFPDFIHGIGLNKWENPIVETYSIAATPTYFLLDAKKTILAKPYDFEALQAYLTKK